MACIFFNIPSSGSTNSQQKPKDRFWMWELVETKALHWYWIWFPPISHLWLLIKFLLC